MFFISLTKNEISQNFDAFNIEETKVNGFIYTSIIDNFLSKRVFEKNGFSIIESPLKQGPDEQKIIFSKIHYNPEKTKLSLSKSTISGRPIYYYLNSNNEFFCSTHIATLRKAGVPIKENTKALPEFFTYRIVMPPRTLFKDINQLCSGDELQISMTNEKSIIQHTKSFNIPEKNHHITSVKEATKEIQYILSQTIEHLSPQTQEIAPILSGGLDSSILCRLCQQELNIKDTYSTGYPFEQPELNMEKKYALSAGKALEMNHRYYEPTVAEYLQGFLESISLSEQPLHHLQMICLHLLYKKGIPQNKRIVVEGWGSGGVIGNFRNYLYYKDKILFRLLVKKPFHFILKSLPKFSDLGEKSVEMLLRSASNLSLSDPLHPIWSFHDYGDQEWTCKYLNESKQSIIQGQYNAIKRFEGYSQYDLSAIYSLLGDEDVTLSILSKISEGNHKITYIPFYDYDFLQYVLSIPWNIKLKRPENILRKSLAHQVHIPDFIINRPKLGFGIQSTQWSKKDGVFEPLVTIAAKVFEEKEIRKMQSTEPIKAQTYWNILNYAIWKRLHIHNEPLSVLIEELKNVI